MASMPPSVRNMYRSYKKSTSAIVIWLISCTGASPEVPSLSLKDMIISAQTIRAAHTEIPPAIYWAFRDAIQNRSVLTEFYKGGDLSGRWMTLVTHLTSTSPTLNVYGVLDIEDLEDSTNENEERRYGPRPMGPHLEDCFRNLGLLDEDGQGRCISGDVLKKYFDVIEFYDYMLEFDDTFSAIHHYWKLCDSGPLQLVITAWLTNIAYKMVKTICYGGHGYFTIHNHEQFLRRRADWLSSNDRSKLGLVDHEGASRETFRDGSGFIDAWGVLQTFLHTKRLAPRDSRTPKFESPRVMVPLPGSQNEPEAASDCMFSLIRSIHELAKVHKPNQHMMKSWEEWTSGQIELDLLPKGFDDWIYKLFPTGFNPLQTDIRDYLADPSSDGTDIVFVIQLWLKTFSTYLSFKEKQPAVGAFAEALNAYTSDNRFDLYYRSPWVAGTHISEILGDAFSNGLPMVIHDGTVCAVLHLYNMFIQLNLVDAKDFQLLELLCSSLDDIASLGKRPHGNFMDHLRTCVTRGAVTKKPGRGERWLLPGQIPSHGDHAVHSISTQFSSFLHILRSKYRVTPRASCQLYGEGTSSRCEKRAQGRWKAEMSDAPDVHLTDSPSRTLEYLHGLVETEFFFGDFPMLRTNWYAVYLMCAKTLKRICELGIPIGFWRGCDMHGLACPDGARLGVHLVAFLAELVDISKEGFGGGTRPLRQLKDIDRIQVA
ncbi:uncharacterized protein BDZ99DRAFT_515013 [Mytilinidion resinicola]|uniref:Uncharacterized protein n=1 Tax=Mytilinidion resinicola TaxID=574789 RepID=A0A6A6Z7X9_9PEZI|nr:uncharacterized protein BDZ99DRAFT_515013 [Mytilinidion resinicola]KAF2816424.1 hypothetical protein BDZ99DRAFT_515013 [Mytilinidion resinicola]